jgi:4-aminobutyrate aminotransferase-like enzyme
MSDAAAERVLATERSLGIPGIQTIVELSGLVVDRAQGSHVWDHRGRRYVDMFMGVGSSVIGHSHPVVREAVVRQLERYAMAPFFTDVRAEYLERLADLLPATHRNIQLYSTGSEAVEAALRLVRSRSGRIDIMAFSGGFHGKTLGALSLHGGDRKRGWGPLLPGVFHAPYPVCGGSSPLATTMGDDFARTLSECAATAAQGELAAVVVEPVQGTSGNVRPAPGFLEAVIRFAREQGAFVVFDEVITGFGRTGTMFAFEQLEDGLLPDVVVVGKAMASGFPASALIAADHLVDEGPFLASSTGSSTFGGNPISVAAALATLDVIESENLVGSARYTAESAAKRLHQWAERLPAIRDVHCAGLMIGIGLATRYRGGWLGRGHFENLFLELLDQGVLAMAYVDRIRLYPCLNIAPTVLHDALDVLEQLLEKLSEQ